MRLTRILAVAALLAGLAAAALARPPKPGLSVTETGTNWIEEVKFFLNGLWIGTNVQITVNSSTQLVSVVNGTTNLLGSGAGGVTDSNAPNLVAFIVNDSATLAWVDGSTNELGFVIERAAASTNSAFTQIASVSSNVTSYTDTNLPPGAAFVWRIASWGNGGTSQWSNVAGAYRLTNLVTAVVVSGTTNTPSDGIVNLENVSPTNHNHSGVYDPAGTANTLSNYVAGTLLPGYLTLAGTNGLASQAWVNLQLGAYLPLNGTATVAQTALAYTGNITFPQLPTGMATNITGGGTWSLSNGAYTFTPTGITAAVQNSLDGKQPASGVLSNLANGNASGVASNLSGAAITAGTVNSNALDAATLSAMWPALTLFTNIATTADATTITVTNLTWPATYQFELVSSNGIGGGTLVYLYSSATQAATNYVSRLVEGATSAATMQYDSPNIGCGNFETSSILNIGGTFKWGRGQGLLAQTQYGQFMTNAMKRIGITSLSQRSYSDTTTTPTYVLFQTRDANGFGSNTTIKVWRTQ